MFRYKFDMHKYHKQLVSVGELEPSLITGSRSQSRKKYRLKPLNIIQWVPELEPVKFPYKRLPEARSRAFLEGIGAETDKTIIKTVLKNRGTGLFLEDAGEKRYRLPNTATNEWLFHRTIYNMYQRVFVKAQEVKINCHILSL